MSQSKAKDLRGLSKQELLQKRDAIEKELLERPIVTVCSSVVKNLYKGLNTNGAINISIFLTFMCTGLILAKIVLGIFFN